MLIIDYDECNIPIYMVCNDQGLCLIRTTDPAIAQFINDRCSGIDPNLRLSVGGDPGTKLPKSPLWTRVRRFTK